MHAALQNLLKLQALEFETPLTSSTEAQVQQLRLAIPTPILGHYDRLRVRGKKGIAVVRNQSCTGCHMRQPIGKVTVLMRGEDIQLCDSCGRYLYLPDEGESQFVEKMAATKPVEKPKRSSRKKALAATG